MSSSFLSNYEQAEPTIRKLYDSKLRLGIIDALSNGPMRLADLRRAINANAPNTSAKAKELEGMGLLERISGDYSLTPYGKAVRARAEDSFKFYSTYEKFKDFWEKHKTEGIPDFLWKRLGDLNDAHLEQTTPANVTKVHDIFVELLNSIEKKFYGVSPIYHNEYLKAAVMLTKKGIDTQLVLSQEVLDICVTSEIEDVVDILDNSDNCGIYVIQDVDVAFTVSENFLSMALKSKHLEASYMDMDLQSTNPLAVQWGLDLFDYYKKQAKPVKLSDYL